MPNYAFQAVRALSSVVRIDQSKIVYRKIYKGELIEITTEHLRDILRTIRTVSLIMPLIIEMVNVQKEYCLIMRRYKDYQAKIDVKKKKEDLMTRNIFKISQILEED